MRGTPILNVSLTSDRIRRFADVKHRIAQELGHPVSNQQALHCCLEVFASAEIGPDLLDGWVDRRRGSNGQRGRYDDDTDD